MKYQITYNSSSPSKLYTINDNELSFFEELSNTLSQSENNCIHLVRMNDGTLSVLYQNYPIGKIKMQGRKHWMQILKGLYDTKTINGDYQAFINNIPLWVKYLRWL